VWDTFQLHVAAWNDQMSTLDKKVDILSRWVGGHRSRITQTERSPRHEDRPGDLVLLNGGAQGQLAS
jgi:hypothetical protein